MSDSVKNMLQVLPKYQGKERMVTRRQDTYDIIREILKKHKACIGHYDEIAAPFWKGNTADTASNLYYFAKQNLPYKVEPTLNQTVKTPAAILEERFIYGNDCKHYASIIVGIGEALRRMGHPIKVFYRFASYNPKSRAPGHVFAVFVDQGEEIWADPVPEIGGFNKRYIKPKYITDKMPPMSKNGKSIGSLYDISGIPIPSNRYVAGLDPTRTISGRRSHWLDHMHPHRQQVGKVKIKLPKIRVPKIKAPHIKIKPGKLFKKVGLATSRNAYLLLLKLNVFNMAVKIWQKAAHDKNSASWKALAKKWDNLGGKPDVFYKNVKLGVNTHNKLHKNQKVSGSGYEDMSGTEEISGADIDGVNNEDVIGYYHDDMSIGDILVFVHANHHANRRTKGTIGVAQVAVAAGVIAAAAPIIKALAGLLKSFGVNTDKAEAAGEEDTEKLAAEHNEAGGDGEVKADGTTQHKTGVETKVKNNADGTQDLEVKSIPGLNPGEGEEGESGGGKKGLIKKDADSGEDKEDSGGGMKAMLANVVTFVGEHKGWFIAGTVIITAAFVIPKIINHKKGRR